MNKNFLMPIVILCLLITSCSKKNEQPSDQTNVIINGTVYPVVKIGSQTWTSVNYNGDGGENYARSSTNNPLYGKFYTLPEAKAIKVPSGWRLPTKDDFNKMLKYAGATGTNSFGLVGDGAVKLKLASTTDWTYTNGDNSLGFTAYPSGAAESGFSDFINEATEFWSSTPTDNQDQFILSITSRLYYPTIQNSAYVFIILKLNLQYTRLPIRFVKDN